MTGRTRRLARQPRALPWRTGLLALSLASLAALGAGTTDATPGVAVESRPETRSAPAAAERRAERRAERPALGSRAIDATPASFSGASSR